MTFTLRRYILALLIILAGLAFLLNNLGWVDIDIRWIFATFWPIILLLYGFTCLYNGIRPLFKGKRMQYYPIMFGLIIIGLGGNFLARNLNYPSVNIGKAISLLWPLFIIYIGITLLLPLKKKKFRYHTDPDTQGDKDRWSGFASRPERLWAGEAQIGNQPFQLEDKNYRLGLGSLHLNLSQAVVPDGETVLGVQGLVGEITIYLPADIPARIEGQVRVGEITVLGVHENGISKVTTVKTPGFDEAQKRIVLHISLLCGEVKVVRI